MYGVYVAGAWESIFQTAGNAAVGRSGEADCWFEKENSKHDKFVMILTPVLSRLPVIIGV